MAIRHLDQTELSLRWSISPRTLERWRWIGQGPRYLKIGGRIVYRVEEVEAFEAQQTRTSTSDVQATPALARSACPPPREKSERRFAEKRCRTKPARESQSMLVAHLTTHSPPPLRLSIAEALTKIALTENEFCDHVTDAVPGEVIAYHVGMLAADRSLSVSTLPEGRRIELNAVANRALQLSDAGLVHLLQRRVGSERFAYLAVVRPQPRRTGPAMAQPVLGHYLPEAA